MLEDVYNNENKTVDIDTRAAQLWKMYDDGVAYQNSIGLSKNVPLFVRFYEGDQWEPQTEDTKNLPRPVVNVVKMICRNKRSCLLSVPIKLVYKSDDVNVDAEKFTRFAEYQMPSMKMKELDARAIKDAVVKGSYFYHFYWDSEATGRKGLKDGGLRCEVVDILNFFVANPKEVDEQKQKWILIASREELETVRAKADKGVELSRIVGDETDIRITDAAEQSSAKLCTVLTRYFKIKGEVFCEKATKNILVNKAFPIAPDIEKAKRKLGLSSNEDVANNNLPDNTYTGQGQHKFKATLYPIVAGSYEERERCIYGLSEVAGLIANQKAINFILAMYILSTENLAWSKYIVDKKALNGQTITNEPGQVLVDYSDSGNGIRKMQEPNLSQLPLQLVNVIMDLTRSITGSTEIMTGESLGANMSGAAIAQLQSQANMPIEELRERFWRVKERQGKVIEQFYKLYYQNEEFSYKKEASDDDNSEEIVIPALFNGEDYIDTNFDVVVEATSGTRASAAGDINVLDALLAKGAITVGTYIKNYPSDSLSNKSELIKAVEAEQISQISQATAKIKEMEQQLLQSASLIQRQSDVVNNVVSTIKENNKLRALIASLYSEAKAKVDYANKASASFDTVKNDATEFAEIINNFINDDDSQNSNQTEKNIQN